jgi:Arc/MetJ-type ribon-helix-helix transcriptional regulator
MPFRVAFSKYQNAVISDLVSRGRYKSRNDLLKDAVRLVAEREAALEKLDKPVRRPRKQVSKDRKR